MIEITKESQIWVDNKANEYVDTPLETMTDLYSGLLDIVKQYLHNKDSHATKGLLETAEHHGHLLLKELEFKINNKYRNKNPIGIEYLGPNV